ncbi:MAG: pyruvate kinase [Paramuribaculum sp.]|nr:pyruvate kinase [Paramuribaculum sp.]
MKKHYVMATVADNRCTPEFIRSLRDAGMESVRINSAHVNAGTFRRMVEIIRGVDSGIKILMDTKGPEIRTTALPSPVQVVEGDMVCFESGWADSVAGHIFVAVSGLESYLEVGRQILFDDGDIRFEVTAVNGTEIICRAMNNGIMDSRKTVAFPGVEIHSLPAVSERDRDNILLAVETEIDMIAHSFVRSAADVECVRALLGDSRISLYAKIECREALRNLDSIADAADGLLVARGDLGTQIPLPQIPEVQFRIAMLAAEKCKPTILATQILQSMMTKPSPTRAEISDIALAVAEGFDRLLLCGETAQGAYPCECVGVMYETINQATLIPWKLSTTI